MSSPFFDILSQALGGGATRDISNQLGIEPSQAQSAISMAIPVLVSALQRNASTPGGLQSLENAINRDHDGSVLDDIGGYLGGGARGGVGGSILGHVLGGNQSNVQNGIGRATGLDPSAVGSLLSMLAPILMGALGRANQQTPPTTSINDILTGATSRLQPAQGGGILSQILDRNHDGSAFDDVAKMGMSVLGNLLGGRR